MGYLHINLPDEVIYLTRHGALEQKLPSTHKCHCGKKATLHHAVKIVQAWYPTVWKALYICSRGKQRRWSDKLGRVVENLHINEVVFSNEA